MKKWILPLVLMTLVIMPIWANGETETEDVWPSKPIQMIVPFKAGGDSDFNARTYAKYLEDVLGTSIVIVNVDGGGGSIGATQAKDADPDGYTVFLGDVALALNEASSLTDFGYEAFATAGIVGKNSGEYLTVRSDFPANDANELIELTKKEPNKYKLAANTGATTYYAATVLKTLGAKFNIVNAGSSSERVASLLGGHIDAMFNSMGTIKSYVDNGDFKILGSAASERAKAYPDYPTMTEQGIDLAYDITYVMYFPKGTDDEIVQKFHDACVTVSEKEEYAADIYKAYGQFPYVADIDESIKLLQIEKDKFMAFKDVFSSGN
ncbi:MAG: tripartite tricarboxylate transporter substrate binding protein [Sphaerochaetaceae bacterium]